MSTAILLATKDGGRYIGELLDSLLAQTCKDFTVWLHDDGSEDDTLSIYERYRSDDPDRFRILEGPPQNGARENFFYLMRSVEADHYLFADDDDVWREDKVQKLMEALLTEEESLLSILESAETVEDIITVQDRLSQVRYELENMESQLRAYDNQVDYSTVYLDLDEVAKYTPVEEKGAFARMGEGFVESLKSVCNGIKEFIIWFVIHIPQLLFLAIFVAVIWISCKKIKEKKASGVTNNAGIKSEAKEEKTTLEKTEGKDGK